MRYSILILVLIYSLAYSLAFAQMPAGLQEAMACMQSIDQAAMEKMADEGKAMSSKLEAMCKKGDEAGAKKTAMAYAIKMMDDKNIKKMTECAEKMKEAMPGMAMPDMPTEEMTKEKAESICDNFND